MRPPAAHVTRAALQGGLPARIETSDGRVRTVLQVHDAWRVGNRWWRGETPSRHYLLEVYEQGGAWHLERLVGG